MGPFDPISPKKQVWNLYESLSPAESPQVQVSNVWINYNGNIQAKVSLIERKKKKRNEKNLTIHVYKIHITTCWAGNYKLETCEVALYWPIDHIFNTSSWNWAIFIEHLRMGRWAPALGLWVRESLLPPACGHSHGRSLQCREVEKELIQCPCPPSQSHKANAKQMSSKGGKMKWKAHLGFIELKTKSQEKLGLWWAQSLPLMHFFFSHRGTCKLASRFSNRQQEIEERCEKEECMIKRWVWVRQPKPAGSDSLDPLCLHSRSLTLQDTHPSSSTL